VGAADTTARTIIINVLLLLLLLLLFLLVEVFLKHFVNKNYRDKKESDVSTVQRSLSSKVKIKIYISTKYIVEQKEVTNVKRMKMLKSGALKTIRTYKNKVKKKTI